MGAEWIVVFIVLGLAVGYAAWRVCQTFRRADDPCQACEGCPLKDQMQHRSGCCSQQSAKSGCCSSHRTKVPPCKKSN